MILADQAGAHAFPSLQPPLSSLVHPAGTGRASKALLGVRLLLSKGTSLLHQPGPNQSCQRGLERFLWIPQTPWLSGVTDGISVLCPPKDPYTK